MIATAEQDPATVLADEYATALLDTAEPEGLAETVAGDLAVVAQAVGQVPELEVFWLTPLIPVDVRVERIVAALDGRVCGLTLDFLRVLIRNGRGGLVALVGERYALLRDVRGGKVPVTVTTAVPLDEATKEQVASALREALDAEPVMRVEVDPDVLGGVTVRIGDRVMDASLAGALARLRAELIRRGSERMAL